ncbi:unnamed protein product [Prunus armeniaca]
MRIGVPPVFSFYETCRSASTLAVRQAVARTFVEQKGARQKGWAAHALAVRQGCVLFLSWLLRVESWEEEIGAGTVRQGGAWREAGFILFTPPLVSSEFGKGVLPGRGFTSTISAGETWPSSFGKSGAGFGVGSWKEKNRSWALGQHLGKRGRSNFGSELVRLRPPWLGSSLGVLISLELGPVATFWVSRANHGSSVLSWFQVLSSFYRNCRSASAWFQLNQASASKAREEGKKIGARSEVLVLWFPGILELGLLSWVLADSATNRSRGWVIKRVGTSLCTAQPDPLGAGAFGKQRFEGALSTLVELGTRVSAKWLRHGSPRAGS